MHSHSTMLSMFIGMFIIQYFLSSYIMTNRLGNMTNSIGKIYMCIIMGLFMVLLHILMQERFNTNQFSLILGLTLFFIYLYRLQVGVDEKNYLREMIEHHSMALLTSKNIVKKTKNPAVHNLATKIITTQENEIDDMRYILKSI